jgi:hypothetical protein
VYKDSLMSKKLDSSVELKVPVNGDYVSVVRLLVSGLATRLGLPVDEIENLKLVVGEAFLTIVAVTEQAVGLVSLRWREHENHISVSLSDPSGKHQSVTSAASLAVLRTLGGRYDSSVVDGVTHLDMDFEIKYKENRPFIFHDRRDGRA